MTHLLSIQTPSPGCDRHGWRKHWKCRSIFSAGEGFIYINTSNLDLADQIQRWRQSLGARGPLGWAHFARMRSNVLRGLYLAQQFLGVTADAEVMNFGNLDHAFRIHHEGTAQRKAGVFDQYVEVAA